MLLFFNYYWKNLHYSYHLKTPDKPLRVPCNLLVKQQCYTPAGTAQKRVMDNIPWTTHLLSPLLWCFYHPWSCPSSCKNLCPVGLQLCHTALSLFQESSYLENRQDGWICWPERLEGIHTNSQCISLASLPGGEKKKPPWPWIFVENLLKLILTLSDFI